MQADRALARRIEAAQVDGITESLKAYRRLHPDSSAEWMPAAGGCAFFVEDDTFLSRAFGVGMDGPVSADDLDAIEAFYRRHNVPPRLQYCPFADPSLLRLLEQRGYVLTLIGNMLACPLPRADAAVAPPGVHIRIAEPHEDGLWADVLSRGLSTDFPLRQDVARSFFHEPRVLCLLAYVDGEPAAAAGLDPNPACAALFSAATLPEFRRRGVHTALIHARLRLAAEQGCPVAVIATVPGGGSERNARRAGFEIVYARVHLERRT